MQEVEVFLICIIYELRRPIFDLLMEYLEEVESLWKLSLSLRGSVVVVS